jgi:branched-chain amino acid aminotransferase
VTSARGWGDPTADRGLHLGDGLFETLLVRDGRPVRLAAHLLRMRASGDALGVAVPPALEEFAADALPALWTREGRPRRAALRIAVTRGPWSGLEPDDGGAPGVHVVVRALPDDPPPPAAAVVLDAPRIDPRSPLAGHKVLSWMDRVEARRRARAAGADVALLRTVEGDVAEADSANLFAVVDGVVVTPPLDRGVLPGITRARALAALRATGEAVAERPLGGGDLDRATEVFLTSSLAGARPVRSLRDRPLAAPGPLAVRLAACTLDS